MNTAINVAPGATETKWITSLDGLQARSVPLLSPWDAWIECEQFVGAPRLHGEASGAYSETCIICDQSGVALIGPKTAAKYGNISSPNTAAGLGHTNYGRSWRTTTGSFSSGCYYVQSVGGTSDIAPVGDQPTFCLIITDTQQRSAPSVSTSLEAEWLAQVLGANNAAMAVIREFDAPERLTRESIAIAESATAASVPLPTPRLTADGEIMFYGRKDRAYIDLGVHGDGTYSFFCRDLRAGNL